MIRETDDTDHPTHKVRALYTKGKRNMYYELYIDVLFLMNFMMDSLLLLAVKKVMNCPVSNGRVFLGSAAGAALTCLVLACPLPSALKLLAGYVGISSIMVRTGLNLRWGKPFWKAFVLLYGGDSTGITSLDSGREHFFCRSGSCILSAVRYLAVYAPAGAAAVSDL